MTFSLTNGMKTSEFLLTLAVNIAVLASALTKVLPANWAAIAGAVSTALYAVSRGISKNGNTPVPPAAAPPAK